jgi:hypothetical protein
MIEQSASYDFLRNPPTAEATARIIEERQKAGRIPDLSSVTVYAVGAGAGNYARALDERRLDAVREFWRAYFVAARAALPLDHYGGGLLRFEP